MIALHRLISSYCHPILLALLSFSPPSSSLSSRSLPCCENRGHPGINQVHMAYQYQQDSYGYPPVVGGAYNEAGADSGGVPLGSDVYGIGVGVGVAGAVPSGNDSMSGSSGEEDTSRGSGGDSSATSFEDPRVADLPRILLMGPRRGGKTSIQVGFSSAPPHSLFSILLRVGSTCGAATAFQREHGRKLRNPSAVGHFLHLVSSDRSESSPNSFLTCAFPFSSHTEGGFPQNVTT